MIEFKHGNLITDSEVDVICHQVNCQGVMGAGLALQIRKAYPNVFKTYESFCRNKNMQGKSPLGGCLMVYTDKTRSKIVANLFGQEYYSRHNQETNYNALREAIHSLSNNSFLRENKMSIGFPYMIGCGLGGGDWNTVLSIIEEEMTGYPGSVQIWKL